MDGSFVSDFIACEGVLRDKIGAWCRGFVRKLDFCFALKAELWAMLTTVQLAKKKNISQIVESDLKMVFYLINRTGPWSHYAASLVDGISFYLINDLGCHFFHCYKNSNMVSDML